MSNHWVFSTNGSSQVERGTRKYRHDLKFDFHSQTFQEPLTDLRMASINREECMMIEYLNES